jgi:transcriptional regulator with XRE-family HTH domain
MELLARMGLAATFGQNMRVKRVARGVTLEALAHDVGLSYSYVGELERGRRNPTLRVVEKLAKALGADPVDLLRSKEA